MDKSYLPAVNKIIQPNHCPIFNPATLTPGSLPRKQNPLNPDQVGASERERVPGYLSEIGASCQTNYH